MPKYAAAIDTQGIPTKGFAPEQLTAFPGTPKLGQIVTRTDESPQKTYQWLSGAWVRLDTQGYSAVGHTHAIADVSTLSTELGNKALKTTSIGTAAGSGLTGGGDLSANRTLAVDFAPDGTVSSTQAVRANDGRLSNSRPPNGTAGGDLTGSYPNPTIGNNKVTGAKIAADLVQSSTTFNGVTGTASTATPALRRLGTGLNDALAGNTQLNNLSVGGDLALGGYRITGAGAPTGADDLVTKTYVDNMAQGIDAKEAVRFLWRGAGGAPVYTPTAGPAANGQLTGMPNTFSWPDEFGDPITNTILANDRVLVIGTGTPVPVSGSGIYVVTTPGTGTNGVWNRANDFNSAAEVSGGSFVFVTEGENANTGWVLQGGQNITPGTTTLNFVQFTGAGAIVAGPGLAKTGDTLRVNHDNATLYTSEGVLMVKYNGIGASHLALNAVVLTSGAVSGTLPVSKGGTGGTTASTARTNIAAVGYYVHQVSQSLLAGTPSASIAHGLNTLTPTVDVFEGAANTQVILDVVVVDTNNIQIKSDLAYAANALKIVVRG